MRDPQNPDVLAFLVPHVETVPGPERRIETHLTSVDRIEEATGLDFLSGLSTAELKDVESEAAEEVW